MEMEQYLYSLCEMEGIIGGSTLDDLRDLMNIDCLEDNDIVFKMVESPNLDLSEEYDVPPNITFVAHCLKFETSDYKYVLSDFQPSPNHKYFEWVPV